MIHHDNAAGLSDLPVVVDNAVRDLSPHAGEFDSIAAQGTSGLIVASPVALALGKPLVVVRKDCEMARPCRHVKMVENAANAGVRSLFLDDYVGEGKTLDDVKDKLWRHTGSTLACRYEYAHREYKTGRAAREDAPYRHGRGDADDYLRELLRQLAEEQEEMS